MSIANTSTRSGESTEEELFYVVNFENDEGYSVIAADRRIKDEIALFVGHGNFDENAVENPGFQIMMSNLDGYATRSIVEHEKWRDSVEVALLERMDAESVAEVLASLDITPASTDTRVVGEVYAPSWQTIYQVGPLIPVEWGQESVFNDRATAEIGSYVVAGCVAVSTVQLMAYWKWPKSYYEYSNIDWNTLCKYTGVKGNRAGTYKTWTDKMSNAPSHIQQMCTDILWHIGDDVDMNWGSNISTARNSDAVRLLSRLGFWTPEAVGGSRYVKSDVELSIKNHRPVLFTGYSYITDDGRLTDNGHSWLIDGYLEQRWWDAFIIDGHVYKVELFRDFFHNNFGWDGEDSGYYACGLFNTNIGPDLPSNTRAWMGEEYNYQYDWWVWPNIHR